MMARLSGVARGPRPGNVKPYRIQEPPYHVHPGGAAAQQDKPCGEDACPRSTRRVSCDLGPGILPSEPGNCQHHFPLLALALMIQANLRWQGALGDFQQRCYRLDSLPLNGGGRGWGCKGGTGHSETPRACPPIPTFPRQGGRSARGICILRNRLRCLSGRGRLCVREHLIEKEVCHVWIPE